MLSALLNLFALIGAVTLGTFKRVASGGRKTAYVTLTGPASYATGGDVVSADQLNQMMPEYGGNLIITGLPGDFNKIEFFESEIEPANGRFITLDRTNGKLKWFSGGTEVANATNLSGVSIRCRIEYLLMPTG